MGNDFWQGQNKVTSGAMTILDSILARTNASTTTLYYNTYSDSTNQTEIENIRQEQLTNITDLTDMDANNTIIIGVVSEVPYAEVMGDRNNPFC